MNNLKQNKLSSEESSLISTMRNNYIVSITTMGVPDEIEEIKQISISVQNKELNLRVYIPEKELKSVPILFFIHGGGFVSGNLDTHDILARKLAITTKSIVIYPEYTLAPENKFPKQFTELEAILNWVMEEAESWGGDTAKLILIGDSAGGNLVTGLSYKNQYTKEFPIMGQILFYPDTSFFYESNSIKNKSLTHFPTKEILETVRKVYLTNEYELYHPMVSSLLGDLFNMPDTLIITADNDPLRDEGILYHEKLLKNNQNSAHYNFENMEHGFVQYFKLEENKVAGEKVFSLVKDWIQNRIS